MDAMTLDRLGLPDDVTAALAKLRDDLRQTAGANLKGLLLYGGAARGRYRPGRSDINVVVLLEDLTASSLQAIAPALRAAWRAVRVEPILLKPDEIRSTTTAFATKFLDIKEHHIVLAGEDPFVGVEVPRELVRLRVEQVLRNIMLRLRRRYIAVADDATAQTLILLEMARPLALELSALLRLAGKNAPQEDRTAVIFEAAAQAFALDRDALARLADVRAREEPEEDDVQGEVADLYERVLATVSRAADIATRMKDGST